MFRVSFVGFSVFLSQTCQRDPSSPESEQYSQKVIQPAFSFHDVYTHVMVGFVYAGFTKRTVI